MERRSSEWRTPPASDLPKITIPPHVPASAEEKSRRRALGQEADRLRELIGPIGMSTSDLIRQIRDEAEGLDEEPDAIG